MRKLKDKKMYRLFMLLSLLILGIQLSAFEAQAQSIVKVRPTSVTDQMEAQALETQLGQVVPMTHLTKESSLAVKKVRDVLKQERIELKDGQILYAEEILFVHIRKTQRAPRDFDKSLKRAPREWD